MENRENFQNIPSEEMFIAGNLLQSDEQVKTNWNSQTFFVVLTISLLLLFFIRFSFSAIQRSRWTHDLYWCCWPWLLLLRHWRSEMIMKRTMMIWWGKFVIIWVSECFLVCSRISWVSTRSLTMQLIFFRSQ